MNRKYKQRIRQQYRDDIFMKELSSELRNQPNDGNAAPVFWVIRDYKEVVVKDGYGEREKACSFEGSWYEFEFRELIEDEFSEEIDIYTGDMELYELVELINRILGSDEYEVHDINIEPYIVDNTMFLTKQEAKQHIENNRHHYTKKAHTYAMTAWRAPKVERLLKILSKK